MEGRGLGWGNSQSLVTKVIKALRVLYKKKIGAKKSFDGVGKKTRYESLFGKIMSIMLWTSIAGQVDGLGWSVNLKLIQILILGGQIRTTKKIIKILARKRISLRANTCYMLENSSQAIHEQIHEA